MVKGISRQVIVVHPQETKLFDQAIFILRDNAFRDQITDEALMREADRLLRTSVRQKKRGSMVQIAWAGVGGVAVGAAWLLTALL